MLSSKDRDRKKNSTVDEWNCGSNICLFHQAEQWWFSFLSCDRVPESVKKAELMLYSAFSTNNNKRSAQSPRWQTNRTLSKTTTTSIQNPKQHQRKIPVRADWISSLVCQTHTKARWRRETTRTNFYILGILNGHQFYILPYTPYSL
jgi:hypothetical protein